MSPLFRRFHVLRLLLWAGALLFTGGALLDFAAHLLDRKSTRLNSSH